MNDTAEKNKYYGQDRALDRGVEMLIDRALYTNASRLMDKLIELDVITVEDLPNYYTDPDGWTAETCREWIDEHCGLDDEHEQEEHEAEDDYEERLQEFIRERAEPAEIYEWYIVDPYWGARLREAGEVVSDDNDVNLCLWGRQCTGQSVKLDPTFYDVYQNNGLKWHENA